MLKFIVCQTDGAILWTGKAPSFEDVALQKAADRRVVLFSAVEFIDDGRLRINFNTMLTERLSGANDVVPGEGIPVFDLTEDA